MSPSDSSQRIEELLLHADWVRSLARRLVLDAASADDLVQETYVVALERPPQHAGNLRAWLGSVVTSLARSGWRSEARRDQRERAGARPEALPAADELVQEAALSRELVNLVLALDEPYRGVLLLRYFKDRTPTQIARELGRPLATVKTQLQRGHAKLRDELDGKWGDSRAWCVALLPLARGATPAAGVPALVPLAVAASALCLVGWWAVDGWGTQDRPSAGVLTASVADEVELMDDTSGMSETLTRLSPDPTLAERRALVEGEGPSPQSAAIEAPIYHLSGRVVDLQGAPLAGLELEWIDPGTLRWANEERTLVTGPRTWLQVSREEQARLVADPAALERFVTEHFPRPDLGRALLREQEAPRHRAWTNSQGELELDLPELGYGLVSLDPEWGLIGRCALRGDSGREAWLAARRRTVSGRVVDAQGEPCGDLELVLNNAYPPQIGSKLELGRGFQSSSFRLRTDQRGEFQLESKAIAPSFTLAAEDPERGRAWEKFEAAALDDGSGRLRVDLRLSAPEAASRVTGTVYTSAGEPSPRTTVVWGREVCTTDEEGVYALSLPDLGGDLFAARAGWGMAVSAEAGALLDADLDEQRGPDLRLGHESLAIEGRVLTAAGLPARGVSVGLVDGTPFPGEPRCLEDVAAGRALGSVMTDAQGRFRLDGLRARDYRLQARHGGQRATSPARPAGTVGLELVLAD